MVIVFRHFFIIFIAAFLMSACTRTQLPTPVDNSANAYGGNNSDLIPERGIGDDWGNQLESRDSNSGFQDDNSYNGRTILPGIFEPVYFNFDSTAISAAERVKLQQAAKYLSKNPSAGILLEGHCDWYGTAEYNLALGEQRANSARDYLSALGVKSGRIETLSKGSLESTSGLSKVQSNQDRRVEILILK
jgi:peptidoglycan-associated lipoprotein